MTNKKLFKIDLYPSEGLKAEISAWAEAQKESVNQAVLKLLKKVIEKEVAIINIVNIDERIRKRLEELAAEKDTSVEGVINEILQREIRSIDQ